MDAIAIGCPVRLLRNQRGQSLIEMGIIVSIFVLLSMGIIEFGRAFMIANVVTHAVRDGARAAAVIGGTSRNSDGLFTLGDAPVPIDTSISGPIGSQVVSQIQAFADVSTSNFTVFNITETPDPPLSPGQIPVVTLNMTVHIPYIFNLVGNSFDIQRSVTFRDEGRSAP